ncbi:YihY/virulence factor BrkB family protein [Paractinoplanes lichenicola]|uniref:YihY/virulence factor BrkB family protein n=1 Tax=Paractinoplanes lichenicola TaxID=2802976 RepID=A0ABS1VIS2_9ACTN|nr:YihY/virulence factor BrkB family protein [Actinoplanes lichenicola]MBL7254190.1 YihY/virulence factor BrkB family protein [Actinoplanes lichenicola]
MSSTEPVPETRDMRGEELSADDAVHALYHYGRWPLVRDAFIRFRYGDGFSHARAFAFQLCLAIVPFLIALAGLAADLGAEDGGRVVAETILELTPGASDPLVGELLEDSESSSDAGEVALTLGLITGLVALMTAMAQIERGANRIYGVERDRPALFKYLWAGLLAVCAGIPALFGFLLLVGGRAFGDAGARHWPWAGDVRVAWDFVRWPLSLLLIIFAVGLLFKYSPRRRQPGYSWLLFGAVVATALWWLASLLLAGYVRFGSNFGATYGPLTAIMALLLWANLTGIALFLGIAFAAQLEAARVGVERPALQDKWEPSPDEPKAKSGKPRPRRPARIGRGVREKRSG